MGNLTTTEPFEGTVSTSEITINFTIRVKRVFIINDSTTRNLQVKFASTENFGTLKPNEELDFDHHNTEQIILDSPSGNAVEYRVWGFG